MRKITKYIIFFVAAALIISGCGKKVANPLEGVETVKIVDDYSRNVIVPAEITKIAPSGATATMFLMTLAPDMLVGLAASPSTLQRQYFPEETWYLPTFGQFYGSKSTLNMEALINARPQIIIDTGDWKLSGIADMNGIQTQTGVPTVFYQADLPHMASAYRKLGKLLGREEEAEELAQFVEKTVQMANEKRAMIAEEDKLTVLYGTGTTGLAVNAEESSQAQVIEIIGAKNAIVPDVITNKGGGTIINMEQVYKENPDVLIFADGGPYENITESEWRDLDAVKNGMYFEIPGTPYNWVSSPPSVNMVLGVWWMGQLLYPDIYNDYNIIEVAQEYYRLFYHYDLSEEEAREFLANSYFK